MKFRSAALAVLSIASGIGLIILLVRVSGVDWRAMLRQLALVNPHSLLFLAVLMAANTFISAMKWRLMDDVLRHPDDPPVPKMVAFGVTSLGVALGQLLPVQISVSLARTLGTWRTGRALRRGTLGTLCEQGFDFLTVCFLALASVVTYLLRGGPKMWITLALASTGIALIVMGAIVRLLFRLTLSMRTEGAEWRRQLAEMRDSGLLEPKLARRLIVLSSLRFLGLVLMADQTTRAIHLALPMWHFAFAMPFVILAAAIGLTPGGLGLTEFTYTGILKLLGTPLAVASQWALANRLLTFTASIGVAVLGLILLTSRRFSRSKGGAVTCTARV
jgi:uncharacterized membrane protein YbhN (UPF0104 family)